MPIKDIRHFNRYYTRVLGIFDNNVFKLKYSLIEMRTLGEIGRHDKVTAQYLCKILNIDKSYLSRLLISL
ncbi:MarR family transcriptional regulator [Mammaliicoccus sciuri]|uniref:MarR family transcriptional regulator n=1 Tax=Mammaliicoccus sciuri TaxID=1296 RepID=UPI0034DD9A5F